MLPQTFVNDRELRRAVESGVIVVQLRCPKCGEWSTLTRKQLVGIDGTFCHSANCDFHERQDYRALIEGRG